MLLYIDHISGDEMISDGYDLKVIDDVVYEVDAQTIVVSEGDVDIGGNPSAEEQAEALENGAEQKINVVHTFNLQATQFDKKSYLVHLKSFMKATKARIAETDGEEKAAEFEKKAGAYAKKIVGNFKDFDFYTGESMNPDGMVALCNYREDGTTPYFIFWKDAMKATKI